MGIHSFCSNTFFLLQICWRRSWITASVSAQTVKTLLLTCVLCFSGIWLWRAFSSRAMLRFNVMFNKRVSCNTRGNWELLSANQGVLSVMVNHKTVNEVRVLAACGNSQLLCWIVEDIWVVAELSNAISCYQRNIFYNLINPNRSGVL